jgi:hypothetical protein
MAGEGYDHEHSGQHHDEQLPERRERRVVVVVVDGVDQTEQCDAPRDARTCAGESREHQRGRKLLRSPHRNSPRGPRQRRGMPVVEHRRQVIKTALSAVSENSVTVTKPSPWTGE